jgi:hypothetical protein
MRGRDREAGSSVSTAGTDPKYGPYNRTTTSTVRRRYLTIEEIAVEIGPLLVNADRAPRYKSLGQFTVGATVDGRIDGRELILKDERGKEVKFDIVRKEVRRR